MLTLSPGSTCDVCAEEYGPLCQPHSIPCGHVLCRNCCKNIVEKTPSRLQTVCPFCREQFASDSVRLIRTDFTTSGYSTPRFIPGSGCDDEMISDAFSRKVNSALSADGGRTRSEVRRLEDKVAKVAAKKCSVEEVSTLHRELDNWLKFTADPTYAGQMSSLHLSALLLRAILVNHVAHSEASKLSKSVEADLKARLDDSEAANGKLDSENKNLKLKYEARSSECQSLRSELSRFKALSSTLGTSSASASASAASDARRATSVSPTPTVGHGTSSSSHNPAVTPLSRFTSTHSRSMSAQMRSVTPSPTSSRSYTPAPPSITRTYTPAPPSRAKTPGPSSHYAHHAPAQSPPVTPTAPPRTRRMSLSNPFGSSASAAPKISRSTSEEKPDMHHMHERWTPPARSASRAAIY